MYHYEGVRCLPLYSSLHEKNETKFATLDLPVLSKVWYFCASFSDVNSELMQQGCSGKKNE